MSLIVVILLLHDARMAEPLGGDDDHDAGKETEHRPKAGQVLDFGVGVLFVHEHRNGVDDDQQGEHAVAEPDQQFQPVAKEFYESDQFHEIGMMTWRKRMKKPG